MNLTDTAGGGTLPPLLPLHVVGHHHMRRPREDAFCYWFYADVRNSDDVILCRRTDPMQSLPPLLEWATWLACLNSLVAQ